MTDERTSDVEARLGALERENQALRARLDAFQRRFERLSILLGDDPEYFAEMDVQMEMSIMPWLTELDERLEETERYASATLARQRARSDGGSMSKVGRARKLARNELVRRAAQTNRSKIQLPYTKVQELGRPRDEFRYQTVKDAINDLVEAWDCLSTGENDDGQKVVRIDSTEIPKLLVSQVELDLAREDLTQKLMSRRESQGVSA